MDIMERGRGFFPAVGRTPGGADHAVAAAADADVFPPLPPAGRVTVGVVDTGLVLQDENNPHAWFGDHVFWFEQERDRLELGHRDRHEPGYLADADGHGTFVTGVILREAPTARVIMRGVLDRADDGRQALGGHDDSNVAMAVSELAGDSEVKVINLSFAGGVFSNETRNLYEVIQAIHPRVAVVAAAGNGANDVPVWPAAYDEVTAVGALDESGSFTPEGTPPLAQFSNCGYWVDAYAAGVQVLGPFVNFEETGHDIYGIRPPQHFQGWAKWSGTSFASAMVSGRIAQMAIEHDLNGADAAKRVLREAPKIFGDKAAWIRGAD